MLSASNLSQGFFISEVYLVLGGQYLFLREMHFSRFCFESMTYGQRVNKKPAEASDISSWPALVRSAGVSDEGN